MGPSTGEQPAGPHPGLLINTVSHSPIRSLVCRDRADVISQTRSRGLEPAGPPGYLGSAVTSVFRVAGHCLLLTASPCCREYKVISLPNMAKNHETNGPNGLRQCGIID